MVGMVLGPVDNVFYFVRDLPAAVAWYSDRLGREPVLIGGALTAFDIGGARITLHEADDFNVSGPAGTVPYWTVPDVDAVVADWTAHGATTHRGPKTVFTGERLCQLQDPFGNLFGVRQAPRALEATPSSP